MALRYGSFGTSTVAELCPKAEVQAVSAVDDHEFDAPGPETTRVAAAVAKVIRAELDAER